MTKLEREFNAIFEVDRLKTSYSGESARQRLDAALRFVHNVEKRQGVVKVRQRGSVISTHFISGYSYLRHDFILEAKSRHEKWLNRQQNFAFPEWHTERRAEKSGDKELAIKLGEAYHHRIQQLHTSSYASVSYGRGGQDRHSFDIYAKSYRYPATWKDAGARVEYPNGVRTFIFENHRGFEVCRFVITDEVQKKLIADLSLVNGRMNTFGDLFSLKSGHGDLYRRYGLSSSSTTHRRGDSQKFYEVIFTGYSAQFTLNDTDYYEHASKVRTLYQEYAHKQERARILRLQKQMDEWKTQKVNRAERLIMKLCRNLPVRYADARSLGFCETGIKNFCSRYGLNLTSEPLHKLLATQDSYALKLAKHMANNLATKIILSKGDSQNSY